VITLPRTIEMTPARAAIAARLELEYETHSEHLVSLLSPGRRYHRMDPVRVAAHAEAVAAARRAITDVAQALRRLAEGTYGLCEYCLLDIPLDDLEVNPAARHCSACTGRPAF
jgi:DnaK suppressor protein